MSMLCRGAAGRQQLSLGLVTPVGAPRQGIDGIVYQESRYSGGSVLEGMSAVIVASRGAAEIIRGWDGREQAQAWMRGRLPSVAGLLSPPPASRQSRVWAEEQALAYLLTHLPQASSLAGPLSCYVFSADVRDEIYRAILATAIGRSGGLAIRQPGPAKPEDVAAEAEARYAWAPAWARKDLGGQPPVAWLLCGAARHDRRQPRRRPRRHLPAAVAAPGIRTRPVGFEDQNFSSSRSSSAGRPASAQTGRAAAPRPHATRDLAGYPYLRHLAIREWHRVRREGKAAQPQTRPGNPRLRRPRHLFPRRHWRASARRPYSTYVGVSQAVSPELAARASLCSESCR
jgi:hypothetical protein